MKKKIIIYCLLVAFFLILSALIKRYQYGWPDISSAIGVITIGLVFIIQLVFHKRRKITLIVGLISISVYLILIMAIHNTWPQGLDGQLTIKADYNSFPWEKAEPSDFNVNVAKLNEELKLLENSEYLKSFLLVKNGKLVVEEYFNGAEANDAFNVKSVTKSILSALVGIAIEKGFIQSVNDNMLDYFPDFKSKIEDNNYSKITIQDLLTMQSGLEVKPKTLKTFDIEEALLESRFNSDKHKSFHYNSPSAEILSNLITVTTEQSMLDFASNELFAPLGINIRYWPRSSKGVYLGGADLFMTARDMARFGFLYLQEGNIDRKQILSENWVAESTISYDSTYGRFACTEQTGYGYLWRIGKQSDHTFYSASGFGGQAIIIFPEQDIVMTFTHYWRSGSDWQKNDREGDSFCKIIDLFTKENEIIGGV